MNSERKICPVMSHWVVRTITENAHQSVKRHNYQLQKQLCVGSQCALWRPGPGKNRHRGRCSYGGPDGPLFDDPMRENSQDERNAIDET